MFWRLETLICPYRGTVICHTTVISDPFTGESKNGFVRDCF